MYQVIQSARTGRLQLAEVPEPLVAPGHVLVANAASIVSAGTEKMVTELARKSLVARAVAQPHHVRRVLEKMRSDGVLATLGQVAVKLDEPISLGYSSAGIVLAVGAGVEGIRPGDRVASNGPHASIVNVPKHLCALVPGELSLDQAAFGVLGSIALEGIRLAKLALAETALVIGLGLIGQLTVKLLRAQGCRVLGTDPDPAKCDLARRMGAERAAPQLSSEEVAAATGGIGADAVLITAATASDGPIQLAGRAVRSKGRVVVVGSVGMNVPRQPFFLKEAELVVSCSYGPGRYDPDYEQRGHDYPVGHVRWTENRNLQAVLALMAGGQLDVSGLVTHRFAIDQAAAAYELIEKGTEPYLGIVLEYPEIDPARPRRRRVGGARRVPEGKIGFGCLGAGNFARMVLLPALARSPRFEPVVLCSAGGLSATASHERLGFSSATSDEDEVFGDPSVGVVFDITRHDLHAAHVLKAIEAGKHIFVEKPLALTCEQICEIDRALIEAGPAAPLVMVGFNRRFSEAARHVRAFFQDVDEPLTIAVRFNPGALPADHWTQHEATSGGRIVGEACHAIDLATFLAGSPPTRVYAESIGGPHAPAITADQCFITLRHANGAVSSVAYLSGGDRGIPKERVEVFGGGRAAVLDDFKQVVTSARGRTETWKRARLDKGHAAEIEAFGEAVALAREAPIAWEDLRAVSLAAILAVRSIREGVPLDIPQSFDFPPVNTTE